MNDQLKTGIHRALKLPAEIPAQRVGAMIGSVLLGLVLGGVGVGLLYAMVRVYIATTSLSMPLLFAGGAFLMIGGNVASKQLLAASLKSLISPIQAIKRAIKNGDE